MSQKSQKYFCWKRKRSKDRNDRMEEIRIENYLSDKSIGHTQKSRE
jgi:hypothetical protein